MAATKKIAAIICIAGLLFLAACAGISDKKERSASIINTLSADGKTDTYDLIKSLGFNYETPDDPRHGNHQNMKHITQVLDPFLNKHVFAMKLCHNHNATDTWTNRAVTTGQLNDLANSQKVDRQRNEFKTDASSPEWGKAKNGDTVIYRWKFKLQEGLMASSNFTHLFQLKAVGGDESQPIITMTARRRTGGNPTQEMQLIYRYASDSDIDRNRYLVELIPLDDFYGEWVQAVLKVTYSDVNPALDFTAARMRDNKELMRYVYNAAEWKIEVPFRTYRRGNTFVRPKWGIYRQILRDGGQPVTGPLRDETIFVADMEIETFARR